MVWLHMPDKTRALRARPPWRGHNIAFGVGVMSLLLGLDKLDKSLPHYLAGRLHHALEAGKVVKFNLSLIINGHLFGLPDWH